MARVFVSFLGLGSVQRDSITKEIISASYGNADYVISESETIKTEYAQIASLKKMYESGEKPDISYFLVTKESKQFQWEPEGKLKDCLNTFDPDMNIQLIDISTNLDVDNQWVIFEKVLTHIPAGCDLYLDMTHGLRAVPVLLSVATNFMIQSKKIILKGVYYCTYDQGIDGPFEIVDMKEFFKINQWSDAVRSLVKDANADDIQTLASQEKSDRFSQLNDPILSSALKELSDVIKSANSERIASAVNSVLLRVENLKNSSTSISKILMDLIVEKFSDLALPENEHKFSVGWFDCQIELAKLLLDHQFLMQGLTIMREFLTSLIQAIVTINVSKDSPGCLEYCEGHKLSEFKKRFITNVRADIVPSVEFVLLGVKDQLEDRINGMRNPRSVSKDILEKFIRGFVTNDFKEKFYVVDMTFVEDLADLRNDFNHAWTERNTLDSTWSESASQRSKDYLKQIKELYNSLKSILQSSEMKILEAK